MSNRGKGAPLALTVSWPTPDEPVETRGFQILCHTMSKNFAASIEQGYRWGIAGWIGSLLGNVSIPDVTTIFNNPIEGVAIILVLTALFLLLVLMGAIFDQLISFTVGSLKQPSE